MAGSRFSCPKVLHEDGTSITFGSNGTDSNGKSINPVRVSGEGVKQLVQEGLRSVVQTYTIDGPKDEAYVKETAQLIVEFLPKAGPLGEVTKKQFQIARAWMIHTNKLRADARAVGDKTKRPLAFKVFVDATLKLEDARRQAMFSQSRPDGFADIIAPWNTTKSVAPIVSMADTVDGLV